MQITQIQERLEKLPHEIQLAGESFAKHKSEYEYLAEMRKTILSAESPHELPQWRAEKVARATEKYSNHLKVLQQSRYDSLRAKAISIARQAEFDAIRSLSSLEKAMTKNL